ncbi:unnamed protein product [Miscanthus lutarioriparius]|uniref:Uncharacterized protein n=1 Tax=Miscanthus lutarioriparius TaxID=422564 RepID=A0A811SFQ5_9POAL|nr:unnamed protein product [Miscanthus lutarioriparius]
MSKTPLPQYAPSRHFLAGRQIRKPPVTTLPMRHGTGARSGNDITAPTRTREKWTHAKGAAESLAGHSPAPANGEMGGVVPSGEAGGVLAALLGDDGYPAGRLIMMLRVTFTGVSSLLEAGEGGTNAATSSAGSTRSTKPQVRSNGNADYDGACFFFSAAAVTSSLTIDLDGGGAHGLLAEAAEAGVRARAREGVVPQLVEEAHPSPS